MREFAVRLLLLRVSEAIPIVSPTRKPRHELNYGKAKVNSWEGKSTRPHSYTEKYRQLRGAESGRNEH